MEVFRVLAISAWIVMSVDSMKYVPCEVAQEVERFRKIGGKFTNFDYKKTIALAVCMAGYHDYNVRYKLVHANNTGYFGVLNVRNDEFHQCAPAIDDEVYHFRKPEFWDRYLSGTPINEAHVRCWANAISRSSSRLKSLAALCSPRFVRKIHCKVQGQGTVEVYDPIYKYALEKAFYSGKNPLEILRAMATPTRKPTLPCTQRPSSPKPVTSGTTVATCAMYHPCPICKDSHHSSNILKAILGTLMVIFLVQALALVVAFYRSSRIRRYHSILACANPELHQYGKTNTEVI